MSNTEPVTAIPPHGGRLVNRIAGEAERAHWLAQAPSMKHLTLDETHLSDVEMLAVGALSPLDGFVGSRDYAGIVEKMRLHNGLPWAIPITLAVSGEQAKALKEQDAIALDDAQGQLIAILQQEEQYTYDKTKEAQQVYRTADAAHPGVARLMAQGEVYVAGPITLINRPAYTNFQSYRLDPAQTRAAFAAKGWRRIVGFQTRNPVHRAHEYIQKCALEIVDGLLLHPLVGWTKGDDIPADVRMRCYEILLEQYYPKDRVLLSVFPATMRYAGPREAIFHAICRKNYGCTHFIVGRDHAGVGKYYGTFDAHKIFDEFAPGELDITPLFFDHAFYCKTCAGMASVKTCPHDASARVSLSGTAVRALLAEGKLPPPEFSRPEVAQVLIDAMVRAAKINA